MKEIKRYKLYTHTGRSETRTAMTPDEKGDWSYFDAIEEHERDLRAENIELRKEIDDLKHKLTSDMEWGLFRATDRARGRLDFARHLYHIIAERQTTSAERYLMDRLKRSIEHNVKLVPDDCGDWYYSSPKTGL